jgi:anti-anti-sigma regulatory factor
MTFRISREKRGAETVLRLEGELVGTETWRTFCDQIIRAVGVRGCVVLNVAAVTAYDDACLATIEAGLGRWLAVEGGGEYLAALLCRRGSR